MASDKEEKMDGYFTLAEWVGNKRFIKKLEANKVNVCQYLKSRSEKYKKASWAMKRILYVYQYTPCKERYDIVAEHLKFRFDDGVNLAAMRLINSFDKKERTQLKDVVAAYKKKAPNTSSIHREIEKFESSL